MENFNINRDIAHLAILQRIELESSKLKKIFKEVVIIKDDKLTVHKSKRILCKFMK